MADTMNGLKRTAYCGELTTAQIGQELVLAGWAAKQRNLGNLIFIDLRDRTGIAQLAFDDSSDRAAFEKAASVRGEYVLMARGMLRRRESVNRDIPTGEVELYVTELKILAVSETPPFDIKDGIKTNEELRLRYRYLDLRRPELQSAILMRHRIVKLVRDYFDQNHFVEIETPILIKSTPEGARDYLVPSRVHPGKFYALPQSPQLYKQLSMLAGFDRYLQIARCFRDEDLRADRQPEFTQIDLEMSFVDEIDVQTVNEGLMKRIFREILGRDLELPLRRLPWQEAMERFGSDKPDTRFGLELVNLTDLLKNTEFAVFKGAMEAGGSVRAINVKGAAGTLSRKEIDKLADVAKLFKAKGLAFTRATADAHSSSFEKFLTPDEVSAVHERMGLETGDVLLVVADPRDSVVFAALGALRLNLAKRLALIPEGSYDLLWVTDFPLFEYDPDEGRYFAMHHPFTSPNLDDLDKMESDPGHCRARAYDLVLNGTELGGGSIRISDPSVQSRMFAALGMSPEEAQEKFGFLLNAFKYGVPPHGGMAYGLDRLVMLLLGKDSIRDVIAYPKVQNASELMTDCPNTVDSKSLDELSIAVTRTED
ncbi:aspartate--tRNA ligase [Yanshouia hominis]|uniref:Aspartate--tRNA ligase n=1 Tax=Yanshouia hominis TaxID=2763673 RepID=A0ABR7NKY5_9FIRM|nr:aspartate--tRNA ligase [Yanshouia hominis]MBC8576298.1 aspartate--tRNA ligase [Yanshouia hominis]